MNTNLYKSKLFAEMMLTGKKRQKESNTQKNINKIG